MASIKNKLPETKYLKECFMYNYETGELTWKPRPRYHFKSDRAYKVWNSTFAGKKAGFASGPYGHIQVGIAGKSYFAHRVIWKLVTDYDPEEFVDHINQDPQDNSFANLRVVTRSKNCKNLKRRANSGRVPGVEDRQGRFFVCIGHEGKRQYLGSTSDFFEAVCTRKSAELRFGYTTHHMRNMEVAYQ